MKGQIATTTLAIASAALLMGSVSAHAQDAFANRGELDTQYCDANNALVPAAPVDPKKWRDPSTLVWAYTPV